MAAVVIDDSKCVGCGICVTFCPVDALEGWGVVRVNEDLCNDCLDCLGTCPVDALEEEV